MVKTKKNINNKTAVKYSTIILGSAGTSTSNGLDYLGKKWGKKRPYIKQDITFNESGEIISLG